MSVEESKLRALSSIAGSLKEIGRIMEAINTNLVKFAEAAKPATVEMSPVKLSAEYYKELAKRAEGYAGGIDPEHNKFARLPNEFDEHFKKEGE
jgi:hypothetical protein